MKFLRTKAIRKPASPGVLASMMLLAVVGASAAVSDTGITPEGGAIRIKAGVLERVIRVSGGNVATEYLTVSGAPLIAGPADEWSFRITRAEPNRNPLELPINSGGPALDVSEAKANDTDALKVSGKVKPGTKPAGDNSSERPSNPANPQQILTPVSDAFRTIRRRMARYRASPPKPRPARIPMNTKKDTQSPIERPDGGTRGIRTLGRVTPTFP